MFFKRPTDEEELQKREAVGTIRASSWVRKFSESQKPIDGGAVYDIHKIIFENAWPEIAGVLRTEEATITDSPHLPSHYSQVPGFMIEFDKELREKMAKLTPLPVVGNLELKFNPKEVAMISEIVHVAAWSHHKIVYIHPFVDGNGRTARLVANLVLERFRLMGISIKVERENKNRYRQALRQIDQKGDYEPLENIIAEGLIDRYQGIRQKVV